MQEKSSNKLIVGDLNIIVIRNKFETLEDVINRDLDIFFLLINNSSRPGQFILNVHLIIHRVGGIPKVRDFYTIKLC